jgi:tellurite resistance protein TehA-like permease
MVDPIGSRLTVLRAAWIAGLVGALGPLAFAIADLLIGVPVDARKFRWLWDLLERVAPIVCPTQLLILMAHRHEHTVFGYFVFGVSLAANIILFAAVGSICWVLLRSLTRVLPGRR